MIYLGLTAIYYNLRLMGRSFMELDFWKKSRIFQKNCFLISKSFPTEEKYNLTSQLLRSARSVCANIAEGHGRFHFKENIQFCRIARGSLAESLNHLICAFDCNYINKEQLDDLISDIESIQRKLNGYIKYLNNQINLL